MDSLTHIASGALFGEALLGKRLGKRAMLFGAIAQSLPDIDIVASLWLEPTQDLLAHRGITHSILFGLVASVLLGWTAWKTHRSYDIPVHKWILFFAIEIGTHLFLDAFNNYGTGWFEPFSHMRISFNTIYVMDPFYSITIVMVFLMLLIIPSAYTGRKAWAVAGLIISSIYLLYALYDKLHINAIVKENMAANHISGNAYFSTPTPFNQWLWFVVAKDSDGFQIGYHSVYDPTRKITFHHVDQNKLPTLPLQYQTQFADLKRFSRGFFTVEIAHDTVIVNDLRFGQVAGWTNPDAPFVFHYYLNHPEANALVVQRGRFEGWNKKTIADFINRIKGAEGR